METGCQGRELVMSDSNRRPSPQTLPKTQIPNRTQEAKCPGTGKEVTPLPGIPQLLSAQKGTPGTTIGGKTCHPPERNLTRTQDQVLETSLPKAGTGATLNPRPGLTLGPGIPTILQQDQNTHLPGRGLT